MNLQEHISKYCTYGEAIHSQEASRRGIDNTPNEQQLEAMRYVAVNVFDRIREYINAPLTASSFFRCPELNGVVHGSSNTSQHMKGEAIDHYHPGLHKEIFRFVRDNIDYDQMIWEFGTNDEPAWVHVSMVNYRPNRKQILRAFVGPDGKSQYVPFDLKID